MAVTAAQPWYGFGTAVLIPQRAHDGVGLVHAARVVAREHGPLAFLDLVVVPPGSSVGMHTHGPDEEVYVVLSGAGTMTVEGESRVVGPGDIVVNPPGGTHGLRNDATSDLTMVVLDLRHQGGAGTAEAMPGSSGTA